MKGTKIHYIWCKQCMPLLYAMHVIAQHNFVQKHFLQYLSKKTHGINQYRILKHLFETFISKMNCRELDKMLKTKWIQTERSIEKHMKCSIRQRIMWAKLQNYLSLTSWHYVGWFYSKKCKILSNMWRTKIVSFYRCAKQDIDRKWVVLDYTNNWWVVEVTYSTCKHLYLIFNFQALVWNQTVSKQFINRFVSWIVYDDKSLVFTSYIYSLCFFSDNNCL